MSMIVRGLLVGTALLVGASVSAPLLAADECGVLCKFEQQYQKNVLAKGDRTSTGERSTGERKYRGLRARSDGGNPPSARETARDSAREEVVASNTGTAKRFGKTSTLPTGSGAKVAAAASLPVADEATQVYTAVRFQYDSAALTPTGKVVLDGICTDLQSFSKQRPRARFVLIGHTDASGDDQYNMRLSESRAEASRAYLAQNCNIGAHKLRAVGLGESSPLSSFSARAAEQRRVEFRIEG